MRDGNSAKLTAGGLLLIKYVLAVLKGIAVFTIHRLGITVTALSQPHVTTGGVAPLAHGLHGERAGCDCNGGPDGYAVRDQRPAAAIAGRSGDQPWPPCRRSVAVHKSTTLCS